MRTRVQARVPLVPRSSGRGRRKSGAQGPLRDDLIWLPALSGLLGKGMFNGAEQTGVQGVQVFGISFGRNKS